MLVKTDETTPTIASVLPLASTRSPAFPLLALLPLKVELVTLRLRLPLLSLMIALLSAEPVT